MFVKLAIRLFILSGLGFLLYASPMEWFSVAISDHIFVESTTSLIALASIVGFIMFIAFTYFVEFIELKHLVYYQKTVSKWINYSYTLLAVFALVMIMIGFEFRKAILISIIFLMITMALDYLKVRIMLTKDMSRSHPKTII